MDKIRNERSEHHFEEKLGVWLSGQESHSAACVCGYVVRKKNLSADEARAAVEAHVAKASSK